MHSSGVKHMALSNFLTYLLSQSLKRKGKHTKSKLILEREPRIFQTLRSSNVMTRLRSGRRRSFSRRHHIYFWFL